MHEHLILSNKTINDAVIMLSHLRSNAILFLIDEHNKLLGSITDGDIRRALIAEAKLDTPLTKIIQSNPISIDASNVDVAQIKHWRENQFKIVPIVNDEKVVIDILNFNKRKSILPIDCVIMAGGKGERLRPLTLKTPKPLLKVGKKPILEHGIDHLSYYGISNFYITTNYLSEQIEEFIASKKDNSQSIHCIKEPEFRGTIGSLSLIENFGEDTVLLCNSDLLSNVNIESFFLDFKNEKADCSVLSIPHKVDVPFGVFKQNGREVLSIEEKPTYIYETNGGMYLIKRSLLNKIPKNKPFTAVEFLHMLISENKKVIHFRHNGYWMDIGQHSDFEQAQIDIKYLFDNTYR